MKWIVSTFGIPMGKAIINKLVQIGVLDVTKSAILLTSAYIFGKHAKEISTGIIAAFGLGGLLILGSMYIGVGKKGSGKKKSD